MKKRELILALFDGGLRNYHRISRQTGAHVGYVSQVLADAGKVERRARGDDTKVARAAAMWLAGERDFTVMAERLESTTAAVKVYLSNARRSGLIVEKEARCWHGARARVPIELVDLAEQRGLSPTALAERLLIKIAEDDIVDAVLDGD